MIRIKGKVTKRKRGLVTVMMDLRKLRDEQRRSGIHRKKIHRMIVKVTMIERHIEKGKGSRRNQRGIGNILVTTMMMMK